jgi:predicted RNase H-like nuclease (RuvC/YqgF family)
MENDNINDYEAMYNSLKRLHTATNDAATELQDKNRELYKEIELYHQKLENAQQAVDINKTIVRNALDEQNRIKDAYSEEIRLLKVEVKELKSKLSE